MDSGAAGMNMYDRRPEREPAPNNVPHNFIAQLRLAIARRAKARPMNIQNKILDGLIGGWEMSGITDFMSGMNFTIVVANDPANVLAGEQRANATGVLPKARPAHQWPARLRHGRLLHAREGHVRQPGPQHAARLRHQQLGPGRQQELRIRKMGEAAGCRSAPSGSISSTTRSSTIRRPR